MRRVSEDLARKLKEAGLEWTPKPGDTCLDDYGRQGIIARDVDGDLCCQTPAGVTYCVGYEYHECELWLPTLSDLLEWLDKREQHWTINAFYKSEKAKPEYYTTIHKKHGGCAQYFVDETAEDSAAQAVLWVLQQKEEV